MEATAKYATCAFLQSPTAYGTSRHIMAHGMNCNGVCILTAELCQILYDPVHRPDIVIVIVIVIKLAVECGNRRDRHFVLPRL